MGAQDGVQPPYKLKYQAAAAANVVVSATPAYLHSIIVGEDKAGGIIEVSNHASDGDGNVVLLIKDPIPRVIQIDAFFDVGICVDQTTQTQCTYIWK